MSRTRELLRSIKNLRILREIASTEGGLNGVGDLIDNFLESEAMQVSIARFKALPGGAEMMEQRFPAFQPNIETLELLPEGTLGRAYAGMIRRLNYDADFFRPRDTSTEALWLTQRIATNHDFILKLASPPTCSSIYWPVLRPSVFNQQNTKPSVEPLHTDSASACRPSPSCCSVGRKAGRNH